MKHSQKSVRSIFVVTTIGLSAALASLPSLGAPPPAPAHSSLAGRIRENLQLSDAQAAEFKRVFAAEADTIRTLLGQIHDRRVELRQVIHDISSSDEQIRAAAGKLAESEMEMALERAKLVKRLKPLLTEEQVQRLTSFEARFDQWIDGVISTLPARLSGQ